MANIISSQNVALLKKVLQECQAQIEKIKEEFSIGSLGVAISQTENPDQLLIMLEVYPDSKEEIGLILTITIEKRGGNIIADYYISKESYGFFLSPREFVIVNDTIPDDFITSLKEFCTVLELAIRNFVFDRGSYVSMVS